MGRDDSILVFGEDVAGMGGVFGATRRLQKEFGPRRVFDCPISETAFVGMAVGAAQAGLRPVVELMFGDFIGVCFDQVANQMAKNRYMSGGRVSVPLVMRTAVGCIGSAAQHSQVLSATFAHIPGLRVVFPSSLGDLQRMLVSAIRSDDPVIFLEHKRVLKARVGQLVVDDAVPAGEEVQPADLGRCRLVRQGTDCLIVTCGWTVQESLLAADHIQRSHGMSVGVLDLRSLVPLDVQGLVEAARHVPNVLVVDEDYEPYGLTGEVMATIVERLGRQAPAMARLAPTVPVPASLVLEQQVLPSYERIAQAALQLTERG
jgi:pyruvate dehydrogenase E1 component beta subunit